MAPSIVWDALPKTGNPLSILDPMSGSGTTLVCARSRGHRAIGCDTDPLALLIARAWCADTEPEKLKRRAGLVLERARTLRDRLTYKESCPKSADGETRQFINFWFDRGNPPRIERFGNMHIKGSITNRENSSLVRVFEDDYHQEFRRFPCYGCFT